jgi:hypothetical protein
VYKVLDPPLPATMLVAVAQTVFRFAVVAVAAQESFHVVSGMYPFADSFVTGSFAVGAAGGGGF